MFALSAADKKLFAYVCVWLSMTFIIVFIVQEFISHDNYKHIRIYLFSKLILFENYTGNLILPKWIYNKKKKTYISVFYEKFCNEV